jgi:hypothetical protein
MHQAREQVSHDGAKGAAGGNGQNGWHQDAGNLM